MTDPAEVQVVEKKDVKVAKPKREIQTLEQFILFAYSRKGSKVVLQPKVERQIAQQPSLSDESMERLWTSVKGDIVLSVPRQLLLAARGVVGYPGLKGDMRAFVGKVLKRHPVFGSVEISATLSNLPEAPTLVSALETLAVLDLKGLPGLLSEKPLKATQLGEMRRNAMYCLAIWCAETRGLSIEEVNRALLSTLWQPEARRVKDEVARLRAITDIHDLVGVGFACEVISRNAESLAKEAQDARRRELAAIDSLEAVKKSLSELQMEIESKDKELASLRKSMDEAATACDEAIARERDDYSRLSGRLLRSLRADVVLLNEGLHALRRDPPKINVMTDHSERVLDGLRKEINALEQGE